ncbi:copper-binding protein [Ideonella sp. YS5]|uniref:copper-binding protein n=1 Tax=Ideonella sp. YS5 TaxID=3453714 RepID=UPI003EEE9CA8
MKKIVLSTLVIVAASAPFTVAVAQQKVNDMKGMDMPKKPAPQAGATHMAKGEVKKLDAKAGTVTIAHGPVQSLKWPAMTMGFDVKDKMLLDKLAVGKTVDFEFVQDGSKYVVTAVK